MKHLFSLIVIISILSCKQSANDKTQQGHSLSTIDSLKDNFTVTVDAIITKDDTFNLMYQTETKPLWTTNSLLKKKVVGSKAIQKITFVLPKDTFPTKFRIDLGQNRQQKFIDLYKMIFNYQHQELEIKENLISKRFVTNKYAQYFGDGTKADIILSVVDNNYNPLIIATNYFMEVLNNKL